MLRLAPCLVGGKVDSAVAMDTISVHLLQRGIGKTCCWDVQLASIYCLVQAIDSLISAALFDPKSISGLTYLYSGKLVAYPDL